MTLRALDLMWSITKRHALRFPKSISRSIAAISFAAVLVLGISVIESKDAPAGFVSAQNQGICDRTFEVQTAIGTALQTPSKNCADYTTSDLEGFTGTLEVQDLATLTTLKSGDFDGFSGLDRLYIRRNGITELPADIFDGLDSLTQLNFSSNFLEELPAGIFSGLPSLEYLLPYDNLLTSFEADWFDGFDGSASLTWLNFRGNRISTIDADAFDGFSALRWLYLDFNDLRTFPDGLFDGLSSLSTLHANFNDLQTLPSGLFDRMTSDAQPGVNASLSNLYLSNNELTSMPSGLVDNLSALSRLYLHRNELASLPSGFLDDVVRLTNLTLGHNELASLPSGFFSAGNNLELLYLNDNRLTSLDGIGFETLHDVLNLHLQNNELTSLPSSFVTSYVEDAAATPPEKYCLVEINLEQNPFSETWIQSGELSDFLSAFGSIDPRGPGLCSYNGIADDAFAFDFTDVQQLGLGGIDLDVEVTGESMTAWELLTADLATAGSFDILYEFSFGWDGLTIDQDVLDALPYYLEVLRIQDARFDSAVNGASFERFNTGTRGVWTSDWDFRRRDDLSLSINFSHFPTRSYVATAGLNVLELDNMGLTADSGGFLDTIHVGPQGGSRLQGTLRVLRVSNNPELTSIPNDIDGLFNLYGLDFDGTGITSIAADAFSDFSYLAFLSINNSELEEIDVNAFRGDSLEDLQVLEFQNNEISELPAGMFSGMTQLRQVFLNENEIVNLPAGLFEGVTTLDMLQLGSNPGAPFPIDITVEDDDTDPAMKRLHVREGAPQSFNAEVVENGLTSSVVPVEAGATISAEAFALPSGSAVKVPDALRNQRVSASEYCWGLEYCFDGFEFVSDAAPSIIGMSFEPQSQAYAVGDTMQFEVEFDSNVVVEGTPQLSFELGDETRYADYVGGNPHSTLRFEYTVEEKDRDLKQVSMASSMLVYVSGSSITDPETQEVAAVTPRQTEAVLQAVSTKIEITHNTASLITRARIDRIEPTVSSINVSAGARIRLGVDVFGAQDIKDNGLADGIDLMWSDGDAGGNFDGDGREVTYTAPARPGTYTVSVATPFSACRAPATDEIRCGTEFIIKVLRSRASVEPTPVPVNPAGTIPTILTDPDGNQYEVFTPEGGGTFTGDASSLIAGPGVVPNGEIVGLRIAEGGSASNEGNTYQRYTLGGSWYEISAVDASNTSVSSYGLNDAVEVCVPLPNELRSNISGLALVTINSDDSLTILSSRVRLAPSGAKVCGNLSSVPAQVAVGTSGSPAPLPTEVPETDESVLPDTGGAAPSNDGMIWAMMLGSVALIGGLAALRVRRRKSCRNEVRFDDA